MMRAILSILVLVAIGAAVFLLGGIHLGEEKEALLHVAEELPLTVKVARPQQESIIRIVQAPGDVEAVLEVDISSEIVAKIEEMPIEEGDTVKIGDLLCRLDDDNLKAAVQTGEARVARLDAAIDQVDADLEKAQRDCDRQARLSEANATTDKERFEYLTVLKKTKALREMRKQEMAEAQANLTRVKEDLKRTIIESPIDGVISRLNAKQGEVVITGTMNNPGTVIMSISDLSRMQVRARIDEVDVPRVSSGQDARIYLQSDQQAPVPARVIRVASKGTKVLGRDVVYFEALLEVLSTDPRIKPGMTANVEIEVAKRDNAITVPVEAIVHRMRKDLDDEIVKKFDARQANLDLSERARAAQYIKVVYVMKDDVAEVRLIESGIADTHRLEMCDGIGMDDLVIIGPYRSLDQLKNGRKVVLDEDDKKEMEEKSAEEESKAKLADEGSEADKSAKSDDKGKPAVASGTSP